MALRESPFIESLLRVTVGIVIGFIMAIVASTFLLIADFLSTVDKFIDPFFVDGWTKWKIAIPSVLLTAAAVLIFFVRRILGLDASTGLETLSRPFNQIKDWISEPE